MGEELSDQALLDRLGDWEGCYAGEVDVSEDRGCGHLGESCLGI